MKKVYTLLFTICVFVFNLSVFATSIKNNTSTGFIENKGQLEPHVLFYLQLNNQNIVINKDGFSYDNFKVNNEISEHHRIDIIFQNKLSHSSFKTEHPLDHYNNYYTNGLEILNVKTYASVTVLNVYEGIDIRYYIDKESARFKFDYIIHPGANLKQIQFKILGGDAKIKNDELNIKTSLGLLIEKIPYSYLLETSEKIEVNYIALENQVFGLRSEKNTQINTLIVDPMPNLSWATYKGGSSLDEFYELNMDNVGNIYNVGRTSSTNNISTSGAHQTTFSANYDALITKFDTSGALKWSTYYGSTGTEESRNLSIDKSGDIFITGSTNSTSNIATSGSYQSSLAGNKDAFIVKFNSSGNRLWATYFGGTNVEEIYASDIDTSGNLYCSGITSSSNLATSGSYKSSYSGGEDAFIIKFSTSGSYIWGTYLGGSGQDYVQTLRISNNNSIYFTGNSNSTTGVALNAKHQSSFAGTHDAILGKMDVNGSVYWVTYFGGSASDIGLSVDTDEEDNLYFSGSTLSTTKIATSGAYQTSYSGGTDAYFGKMDSSGVIKWCTYFGGSSYDEAYEIQLIEMSLFALGKTNSTSGISTSNAYQTTNGGNYDGYFSKFNLNGEILWSTYYGGTGDDGIKGVRIFDSKLIIAGVTSSTSNIATAGAHQSTFGGVSDGFVALFENLGCELYSEILISPKCFGDSTGSALVKINGGVGSIKYNWKTFPPQYTDTAKNLPKGTYEVVVSDAIGCKDSIKVTITEPSQLKAYVKDSIHISCAGKKDGKLVAGYTGGTPPYSIVWNTNPVQNTDTALGLAKGSYWLKITDKQGCKDSSMANIIEPDTLTSKITGFRNVSCFLLNDGQIDVTAYGGTLPYSYTWSTSPVQNTPSAYNLTAGYYEVTIKDKNNCTTKNNYTITEPSPVTIGTTNLENCICFNDSNGQIFTKVWGGTPGYKISWNTNPISNDLNLKKLSGGSYRLTVVDTLNCVATKTFIIAEPPPIVVKFDSINDVLCKNGNNGSVYAQIAGGTPKYSIFWNSAPFSNQNKLSNLKAGIYKITVKDSMSCQIIDSVRITEPDSIMISGVVTNVQCNGNNSGEIKTSTLGGTAPYTFNWAHDTTINKPTVSQLTAGNYLLTIKDKNKCEGSKQFIVTAPSKIEIHQQLVKPVACHNGMDGRLSVSINGGTPPLKLIWNTTPQRNTLSIDSLKTGYYTATVVDSFGCSDSLSIQLNEPKQLVGYFDSVMSPSCYKNLDGSSIYKVVGGTKPYIYSFDNAPFQNDSLVYKIGAGFVKVKIIDNNGCVLNDSNQLFHPEELKSEALLENISCFGLSDGRIILNTEGGVKPYKYFWSNTTKDTSTVFGLNKGYYYLTIIDKNNCPLKDTFSVTEPDKLLAQVDITLPATCYNGSDGLASGKATGGTKPYDYFWTGLSNQNSQIAKNLRAGNYKLFVKDANGCLDSASTQIGRPEKVKAIISSSKKPTCEFGSDGEATAMAIPGVGPYNYLWSNGSNLEKAQGLKKGNYSVIITDACGDTAMAQVQIDDPAPFIIPNITGYIVAKKGTIETYSIVENNNWSYSWEVENGTIIEGNGTHSIGIKWGTFEKGTVKVTITNELGCVDDNSLNVSLFDECMLVFPNPTSNETSVFIPFYDQAKNLELFDTRGSKLFSEPAQKINTVDVSHLSSGIYIFRYENCKIKLLKN
jgi:hypothetical protein